MKWKLVFGNNEVAPYVFILFVNSVSDSKGNKLFVGEEPHDFTKQLITQFCVSDGRGCYRTSFLIFLCWKGLYYGFGKKGKAFC